jgi:hypothetical protein
LTVTIRINCTKENISSIKYFLEFIKSLFIGYEDRIIYSFGQLGFGESAKANNAVQQLKGGYNEYLAEFASLFHTAKQLGFTSPDFYSVGDVCTYKRSSSLLITTNGLYKCMRAIGRFNYSVDIGSLGNPNLLFDEYKECINKKCAYIPMYHLECKFSASLENKPYRCKYEEIEYINKLILKQFYL